MGLGAEGVFVKFRNVDFSSWVTDNKSRHWFFQPEGCLDVAWVLKILFSV